MNSRSRFFLIACLSLTLVVPAARAFRPPSNPELPNFDSRAALEQPPLAAEKTAAVKALAAQASDIGVDFDEHTGTPKWIRSSEGFLSGPGGAGKAISAKAAATFPIDDPDQPTKAFLQEHADLFGFGPEALTNAHSKREFTAPYSGLRTVIWEQQLDGIPVFEALLVSHTTKAQELVSISSQFIPAASQAADAGTPNREDLVASPIITPEQAVALAMNNLGEDLHEAQVTSTDAGPAGVEQRQHFSAPKLAGDADVKLTWLPMSQQSMRLCWDVILTSRARGEMYRLLVDAETGEALVRHCLTDYLTPATYRVYTSDSPSPFSPGYSTPQTTQPPIVARDLVTISALDTNASPNGWMDDGVNETYGNNVDAHTDRNADNVADLPRPHGSPSRVFDFTLDLTQDPVTYTNAAVVQLFYWNNWMHDKLYELGFTEAAGNFQSNNFGRGGLGNDAVQADAQDGSGTDNANFSTPPDGSPGRMQMYVFTGPTPDRDGDLDAEVVLHEYTHGLSNRRVGGGVGISALQPSGMGEGWSDFYGLSLLSAAGDDVNGVYAAGAYASYLIGAGYLQNYYFGIRRYPYCTDMSKNPLTFKDIDPNQADFCSSGAPFNTGFFGSCSAGSASEVHNIGEVWCATLWEARANIINKYGWTVGNQLMLQLVTDGMNLSPANPTFLQARDAIIQADQVDTGGANRGALWTAFAKRGLGLTATSPASSTTTGVKEAFDVPDSLQITPAVLSSSGPVGGPFTPNPAYFAVTNAGTNSLTWSLSNTAAWITVAPAGGTLTSGAGTTVSVTLGATVTNFPLGTTSATVWFTNQTTGIAQARTFSLNIVGRSMFENFEPGIHAQLWSGFGGTIGSTVIATNYGGSVSGVNSLWFNDAGSRFAATVPLNTSSGGSISFYLRLGNSSYPWENVDIPAEGIVLEYSTNNGAIWTIMGTYDTATFYNWTQVATNLPAASLSTATQFRWRQLSHSGSTFDNWALDDISIDAGPTPPSILTQPASQTARSGSNVVFSVSAQGSSPLSYQWRKDGTNLVSSARISGATNATLSISSLLESDSGLYSVLVTNQYGSVTSSNASLLVTPLDHFNWNVVASPQAVGTPFNTTITAKDFFGATVTNYAGSVGLSGGGVLGQTNLILGNLAASSTSSGTYTLGFAFTPNTNILVTHVRSYSGTKVSIWLTNGTLLATQNVTSVPNTWVETPLATPLALSAGTTYIVSFYTAGGTYYYRSDRTNSFPDGSLVNAYYYAGVDGFPSNTVVSTIVYFVDLRYVTGGGTVPITPTVAGPFTNGIWSGAITVQQAATNTSLRADDGLGHTGTSNPFDVLLQNDVSISGIDSPDPVALGANLTCKLTVANAGPSPATGVTVTNLLPPGVAFVSATASQGTCTQAAGVVTCNLGTLPGGANAAITLVMVPTSLGLLTNFASVSRAEADPYLPNNSATVVTLSQIPAVSISDCSVLEGNAGTTNAAFTVSLSFPGALPVTVDYATADGTALAGSDYVATNGTLIFSPGETNKTVLVTVNGDTVGEPNETFLVNLPRVVNATVADSQGVGSIINDDIPPAAYLRSVAGAPWGSISNETAMNQVFGAGNWQDLRYETLSTSSLFLPATTFIYMEGSDMDATEMEAFLSNNITLVQNWVSNGGNLFLNAAPNEDNGMSFGFGVTLTYPDTSAAGGAAVPGHPIFAGPFSPVGTAWTGTSFGHATVSGPGLIPLITNTTGNHVILGEMTWGAGHVLFGGMTTDNFHSPQPQAHNLRANIIAYLSSLSTYHFDWSAIASPQEINQPFPVTITARDNTNGVVTSFGGAVTFSAQAGISNVIALAPLQSGNFTNGVWSGAITMLQPGQNIVVRANDGAGHAGSSNPFNVGLPNDIAVSVADSPHPVVYGANLTYTLVVTNTGPLPAAGVSLTNLLDPFAGFVSASVSQGDFTNSGRLVLCNLGTINGASSATVTIVAAAQGVNLTNFATIGRAESDPYLTNNSASTITPVVVPALSINDVSVREGNSGTTSAVFTVSLSPPPALPALVYFTTGNGTAVAPSDYISNGGLLNFAVGETNKTIGVTVNGDTQYEADETFTLTLYAPFSCVIARSVGTATIQNDDPAPTVSIGDVTMLEGNVGTNFAVFPVTLSAPAGLTVTVSYATLSGTATNGSDYIATSGSLSFISGITSNYISVPILGDTQIEPDEDFYVDLSNPVNATLAKREGVGLLLNDDGLPGQADHFVWGPAAPVQYVSEPFAEVITAVDAFNNPATSFNGSASLSGLSAGIVATNTILPATSTTTSFTTAYTCGYSFTPTNDITITHVRTFSGSKVSLWTDAGTLLVTQAVSGTVGIWTETPLAVPLKLAAGTRYRLGFYASSNFAYYSSSTVVGFPDGMFNQAYYGAGDVFPTTSTSIQWFLVDLRYTTLQTVSAPLAPASAGPFTNGVWSGAVSVFAPASSLTLKADDGNGHFGLSSPPIAVQLRNDLSLTASDSPDPVCRNGAVTYSLLVTNSGPATATGVVVTNLLPAGSTFVSAVSSQGTCSTNGAAVTCSLGTLTGGAGASVTIVVTTPQIGNLTNRATVYRAESDPYLPNNTATNITPVVSVPSFSINDVSVREGNSGTTNAFFTVSLYPPPVSAASVTFATANGTAISPADYLATNVFLTFAAGQTNRTVPVIVNGNAIYASTKTYFANLSGALNAVVVRTQAVGTIINDDPLPTLSISDVSLFEGNIGATAAVFAVTLSGPSSLTTTFSYGTVNGTAFTGSDYSGKSGSISLPPLTTSTNISVTIVSDMIAEPDEVFYLDISAPVNAALGKREGVCTILNDDGIPGQVDHFTWYPLPSAQYVGQSFPVTILAFDAYNNPASSFTNTVTLTATNAGAAIPLTPGGSSPFNNASWTGNLAVSTAVTNLMLRADDGNGHIGLAGPISFVPRPVLSCATIYSGSLTMTWSGASTLQWASDVAGPWHDLPTATSPWTINTAMGPMYYFRLKAPPASTFSP